MAATTPEPENAYLRNVLRSIGAMIDMMIETPSKFSIEVVPRQGDITRTDVLREVAKLCREALARPLTNDATIDALERRVGDLESHLIDQQILIHERHNAERHAKIAEQDRQAALSELAAVRRAIRPRVRPTPDGSQPDAAFLIDLGERLRGWSQEGMVIGQARAAEIESELQEIAAGIASATGREERAVETAVDRERLLYWICVSHDALSRIEGGSEAATGNAGVGARCLRDVLASFGYDDARIAQMLSLGEPGVRQTQAQWCSAHQRGPVTGVRGLHEADDCCKPENHDGDHHWRCGWCRRLAKDFHEIIVWEDDAEGRRHAFHSGQKLPMCKETE